MGIWVASHSCNEIGVHIFFPISVLGFFGFIHRSGIAESEGHFIFNFLRNPHTVLHLAAPVCISIILLVFLNQDSNQVHISHQMLNLLSLFYQQQCSPLPCSPHPALPATDLLRNSVGWLGECLALTWICLFASLQCNFTFSYIPKSEIQSLRLDETQAPCISVTTPQMERVGTTLHHSRKHGCLGVPLLVMLQWVRCDGLISCSINFPITLSSNDFIC